MMKILWMLSLVAIANGEFTCVQPANIVGPAMPALPDQYEMRVEVNVIQAQKTIEVLESYDKPGQQVALTMIQAGVLSKTIHNFRTSEKYDIYPNGTCKAMDITTATKDYNVFGFVAKGKDGKIHIASVADMFKLGAKYNLSYVAEKQIRGIPVYHWTSCQKSAELHASYKLDFYFSRLPYLSADNSTQIPIRIEINGEVDKTKKAFSHVYEFTMFKPGPIKDKTVFDTPQGVVCVGRKSTVDLPFIMNEFMCDIEIDSIYSRRPANHRIFFDSKEKLVRVDQYRDEKLNREFQPGLFSRIQDYNTGVEYVIDRTEGNCTVRRLIPGLVVTHDAMTVHTSHTHTMKHADDLLSLKDKKFTYQGEREWRGMKVETFSNISNNIVKEFYFRKEEPLPADAGRPQSVLVGVYTKNITAANIAQMKKGQGLDPTNTNHSSSYIHVFNFHRGHQDLDVFDVSLCYTGEGEHSRDYTFVMEGNYYKSVYGHREVFLNNIRDVLGRIANVTKTRITNIQVKPDNGDVNKIIATFTLLDKIPISGYVNNPPKQTSLEDAEKKIMEATKKGIKFHIPSEIWAIGPTAFTMYPDSVKKVLPQTGKGKGKETGSGSSSGMYGPGAMAGLAIAMLIVGGICGLLVAYVIHRRTSSNKYSQDISS